MRQLLQKTLVSRLLYGYKTCVSGCGLVGMLLLNRQGCLALLLVLLISDTALMAHVTTHMTVDQPSCEFCAGHGNPAHSIPPASIELLLPAAREISTDYTRAVARVAEPITYRERAPPINV